MEGFIAVLPGSGVYDAIHFGNAYGHCGTDGEYPIDDNEGYLVRIFIQF